MNLSRPDRAARLDAVAAQYALGTLSSRARRRLAAIARTDAAVAAAIRGWEVRLAALAEAVPDVVPPPRVWDGIRSRLGLAADASPAYPPAPAQWWTNLALWRGLALVGFVAALALGLALLAPPGEQADQRIVAVLAGADAKPVLIASADRGGRFLTVKTVAAVALPPGRVLELWALPPGRDPRSLGLIPATGLARIPLAAPAGVALEGVPAMAVSLEPPGGSPTGKPTGPVLYSGGIQNLY
jgi:anti-sigma-K factor RskA